MEIHITIQGPNKEGYFQGQAIVDDRPIANIHDYTTEVAVWQAAMEAVDGLIYERKVDDDILRAEAR